MDQEGSAKCREQPQQKQTVSVWASSGCFHRAKKQAGALVSAEVRASVEDVGPAEAGRGPSHKG